MKKRITGIVTLYPDKKRRVKGWKVNPYIFIHKEVTKSREHSKNWAVTHIPTGWRFLGGVELRNKLTLSSLISLTNFWFPAWLVKEIKKRPTNVTSEMKIRYKALRGAIEEKQTILWEI